MGFPAIRTLRILIDRPDCCGFTDLRSSMTGVIKGARWFKAYSVRGLKA